MSKLSNIAVAFRQGWHDRINGLPARENYSRVAFAIEAGKPPRIVYDSTTATNVAYERGRHAAALYEFEVSQRGTGTINRTYAEARRDMTIDLRKMIDAERKFCALKPRKKHPLTGL